MGKFKVQLQSVFFKEYKRICIVVELNKRIYATSMCEIKLEVLMLVMTHSELPKIFLLHVVLLSTVIHLHLDHGIGSLIQLLAGTHVGILRKAVAELFLSWKQLLNLVYTLLFKKKICKNLYNRYPTVYIHSSNI